LVSKVVDHFTKDVHLDINRNLLQHTVNVKGNAALDEQRYSFAEHLLRTALRVFPQNIVMEYNLACTLSLQNRVREALESLITAVQDGYSNAQHLMRDTDLTNVRAHPDFLLVKRLLNIVETSDAPVVVAQPATRTPRVSPLQAQAAPQPVVPQPEVPQEEVSVPQVQPSVKKFDEKTEKVNKLRSIFPALNDEAARFALDAASWNVALAVNRLLA